MKFTTSGTLLRGCKVFPHLSSLLQIYFSFMVPTLSCTDMQSQASRGPLKRGPRSCSSWMPTVSHNALSGEELSLQRRNKGLQKRRCLGRIKPAAATVEVSWGSMQVAHSQPSFPVCGTAVYRRRRCRCCCCLPGWCKNRNAAAPHSVPARVVRGLGKCRRQTLLLKARARCSL